MVRHAIYNLLLPKLANLVLPERLPPPMSTFKPSDIAGLQLHLDATQITGLVNLDPVTTWPDTSGFARNSSQATAAKKPQYIATGQNGKPIVRFDGVDDLLSGNHGAIALPYTLIVVGMSTTATGQHRIMDNDANVLIGPYDGLWRLYSNGFVDGPAITTSQWMVAVAIATAADKRLRVNRTPFSAAVAGAALQAGFHIGARGGLNTEFHAGDVAEVLLYNSALSDAQVADLEAHLKDKWGLP